MRLRAYGKMFGGPGTIVQRTKRGLTVSPVTLWAICADCMKGRRNQRDVSHASVGMKGDWCLLKNSVWEQIWPRTSQKSAYAKMPIKYNLCIEHIEKRLGRRLTRKDFDLRSRHNRPNDPTRQFRMSKALRDRLRK
jgi:hypothetical protein